MTNSARPVFHKGGPLLVKAGPGSGKTLVIVERVAKLVADGIRQESILCMTFTEKATDEMRRRLLEKGAGNVQVDTMHALCLEMLKEHGVTTGVTEKNEGVRGIGRDRMVRPQRRRHRV